MLPSRIFPLAVRRVTPCDLDTTGTLGVVLVLGIGIACGLVPALQVSKTNVNDRLKDRGRAGSGAGGVGTRRWTTILLTAEVALTLILLSGAGLMGRSFLALQAETNVVDAAGLTTMGIRLSSARYPTTEERRLFYAAVEERLAAMREVEAFTLASVDPFGWGYPGHSPSTAGRPMSTRRPPA